MSVVDWAVAGLILVLFFPYLYKKRKNKVIAAWEKSLQVPKHRALFLKLYARSNGFLLSQQARSGRDAIDYVYGEIEFTSFIALLSLARPDKKTVFFDLGSGTGKAVLACSMVYPVKESIGVEIFPGLYQESCQQKLGLAQHSAYIECARRIRFILGDFLKVNLDDATLIFINATALFNPTWGKLVARLEQTTHLSKVITTSKPLPSTDFTVVKSTYVSMSWGVVRAFIHERQEKKQTNCVENIE